MNMKKKLELLKSEGASCDVAENGKLVVDKFLASPSYTYDAILMDVMMPVMNGYEATKAIRESRHPEALTIPIVAMTANAFVKDVQDALDAGMNAHISKPINMEMLKTPWLPAFGSKLCIQKSSLFPNGERLLSW